MNDDTPIPVAVFMTAFHPGGTERQMSELIRRLDPARFAVKVACFHREGAWLARVEERATVTAFPIQGFARASTLAQAAVFARWCRRERVRVLQTCDLYANVFALPAAALAGVPVRIGSRREINPDKTDAHITMQRHAYRCAHAVVANSSAARAQLIAEGLDAGQVRVIANGVTVDRFTPTPGVRPPRRVVTVANLRREKGHDTLLRAIAILAPSHPDLEFVIAGGGPLAGELRQLASSLGVAGRVRFGGHVEDVPTLLAGADLFVLPSLTEAFPNAAIEAMAAGLAIVASGVGGLLDLIEHGRTGLLVPPADPAALANAIASLAADPARAAGLGAAAREDARNYSFDRMVRAFEDIYLAHLGPAHARPAAA